MNSTEDHDIGEKMVEYGHEWWVVDRKDCRKPNPEPLFKAIIRPASDEEMKAWKKLAGRMASAERRTTP